MKILPKPISFEWDKGNINKSFKKHGVTNQETEQVFEDDLKFLFRDERHSQKEERYGLFGQTKQGRKLSIVLTIRKDKVRIITVRDMSRRERRVYEEKVKAYSKI